jgi:AraC-like DNA-binding protein/mannose-6-phosphate isomerase-like protein (cupin superfamily)
MQGVLQVFHGIPSCQAEAPPAIARADNYLTKSASTSSISGMKPEPEYDLTFSSTRFVSFERVTRNRVHRHSFYEPCIVISGTGEFEHGSELFALREGDLFIADPGTYHEIRSLKTRDLHLYFLAFNVTRTFRVSRREEKPASFIRQILPAFALDHSVHLPGRSHLISLFEHATKLSRSDVSQVRNRFYRDASLLLLSEIIFSLANSARLSEQDQGDHLLANKIAESIEQRLHRPLRVSELARHCGMSERSLRRKWKSWGRPVLTDEINRRRIARAGHLLLLPDISIAEVGYQVGIQSPAQFSRIFKTINGQTPKAYRRKYLGGVPGTRSGVPPFKTEFVDGDREEYST